MFIQNVENGFNPGVLVVCQNSVIVRVGAIVKITVVVD